jgi:hypothetical protein
MRKFYQISSSYNYFLVIFSIMERGQDARGGEALLRENRELKQLVDKLEQENRDLKKSVYELNMRLSVR